MKLYTVLLLYLLPEEKCASKDMKDLFIFPVGLLKTVMCFGL